jgi:hypothetical protein
MERMLLDRDRGFEREREAFRREREQLLDRIMYLAERPWSVPPAEMQQSGPAPDVEWPVVLAEDMTPDELGEMAEANGAS